MSNEGEQTPKGRDPKTGRYRKGESCCPSGRAKGVPRFSAVAKPASQVLVSTRTHSGLKSYKDNETPPAMRG
jgi:hypothetical protein